VPGLRASARSARVGDDLSGSPSSAEAGVGAAVTGQARASDQADQVRKSAITVRATARRASGRPARLGPAYAPTLSPEATPTRRPSRPAQRAEAAASAAQGRKRGRTARTPASPLAAAPPRAARLWPLSPPGPADASRAASRGAEHPAKASRPPLDRCGEGPSSRSPALGRPIARGAAESEANDVGQVAGADSIGRGAGAARVREAPRSREPERARRPPRAVAPRTAFTSPAAPPGRARSRAPSCNGTPASRGPRTS